MTQLSSQPFWAALYLLASFRGLISAVNSVGLLFHAEGRWECDSQSQYCRMASGLLITLAHYSSRPKPITAYPDTASEPFLETGRPRQQIVPKHFAEPGCSLAPVMNLASPFCLSPRAISHIRRCLLSSRSCTPLLQPMCATCPAHLTLHSLQFLVDHVRSSWSFMVTTCGHSTFTESSFPVRLFIKMHAHRSDDFVA
jgi:hypothetical protein